MYFTIYKITNTINGKFYIGMHKTDNLDDGYFGSGNLIIRAIKKYGKDAFIKEYLFIYNNAEEMYAKECEIVNEDLIKSPECYNLTVGGFGGNRIRDEEHHTHSIEHLSKMGNIAKTLRGTCPIRMQKHRETMIATSKIAHSSGKLRYDNFRGKKHTPESKQKIAEKNKISQSGQCNSQFGTMWITDGTVNKKIKNTDTIPDGWRKGRVTLIK